MAFMDHLVRESSRAFEARYVSEAAPKVGAFPVVTSGKALRVESDE
jgi:hypothetical protein